MNILNYIIKCIEGSSIHHDKSMQKSEKYLITELSNKVDDLFVYIKLTDTAGLK